MPPTYTIPHQEIKFISNTQGNFVKKYSNKDDPSHYIIRYIKNKLEDEESIKLYGKYRSVIIHNESNIVMGFSPPKSKKIDEFMKTNEFSSVEVEELVEGTMINLFYDQKKQEWDIATKSNIGGRNKFVQEEDVKTFRTMFLEACIDAGVNFEKLPVHSLDKDGIEGNYYSYSFVMQHPKNRIVSRTKENRCFIYLVEMYEMSEMPDKTGIFINKVPLDKFEGLFKSFNINTPRTFSFSGYDECIKYIEQEEAWCDKDYICFGGLVLRNKLTNERTKIRTEKYEYIRKLRGNQIKPKYHYLTLRKQKKLQEYLKYFPEEKNKYDVYRSELSDYVYNLWQSYIGCYIKKQKPIKEWPREYRVHMFNIHKTYIENREIITLNKVYIYFNKLHESQQMFSINYKNKPENDSQPVEEIVEEIVENVVEIN